MTSKPLLLNSITDAGPDARGQSAICGSHGGCYAAMLASRAGLRSVLLNDAGIGYEQAGIAGVRDLAAVGMAAAAVDCNSAEIGSARDMLATGVISYANDLAQDLGVKKGQPVDVASEFLMQAQTPQTMLPALAEQRWDEILHSDAPPVLCVDSASLIQKADAGRVIVTGSHGGLIGGDPARACKAAAHFVSFSDAGRGKNDVGIARLAALKTLGIAAATLSCESCAIGDARSALTHGRLSATNSIAHAKGARSGMPLKECLTLFL